MQYSTPFCLLTRREVVVHYYRMPGLTEAATESLLRKAKKSVSEKIERIETEFCYNLQITSDFTPEQKIVVAFSLYNA